MKRNIFGNSVFLPGDEDIGITFLEEFGTEEGPLTAEFIELDPMFTWCCSISDPDGNELEAQEFESEAALRAWLASERVVIQ